MTVISTEGASQLTRNAAQNVTQGLQLASDLLGIDLAALFRNLASQRGPGDGTPGALPGQPGVPAAPPAAASASASTPAGDGGGGLPGAAG